MFLRKSTRFLLAQSAKREQGAPQFFLSQGVENITLILGRVGRFLQKELPILAGDSGIMTGGNRFTGQRVCPLIQLFKLQKAVAVDARVRRAAGHVTADERIDHAFLKGIREVEDVIRHPKAAGNASGILHIVQRAAGFFRLFRQKAAAVQFHGTADADISFFFQQQGSDTAVHPAAHGNQNPFHTNLASGEISLTHTA